MEAFLYSDSPYPIRSDLADANRLVWDHISGAGSWWTAAERVAIAAEVRHARSCGLCVERKGALSPNAVDGRHDSGDSLPDAAVDAVHRIVTDQSRLSEAWVRSLEGEGIHDGHYVELLSIVVFVVNIDAFHEGLGLPLEELPAPRDGAPDGYRPDALAGGEAWVPMLGGGSTAAAESDLYGDLPHAANVLRALSLVPDAVRCLRAIEPAYYIGPPEIVDPTNNAGRAISRRQIELVAARVSALNECFY